MFTEKINEFIKIVERTNDLECLDLMEDLISSAADYIKKVSLLEIGSMIVKFNKDDNEYKKYIEEVDRQKISAHNCLITNVKIINRICRRHNISLIYEGDEKNRLEVAEFAQNMIDELVTSRRV